MRLVTSPDGRRSPGRRPSTPPQAASGAGTPALRAVGVSKWYGSVQALDQVSIDANGGEVVALVGDNGAGKSTLINILAGVIRPDEGEIYINGELTRISSVGVARAYGICTVHQEHSLADNLDVVENMFLGREPARGIGPFRRIDSANMEMRARAALADLGITTIGNIHSPVGQLSGGQRQSVAMGRATLADFPIVLLDEPTTGLGVAESARVVSLIRRLRERGTATVVVSQNIDEIFEIADRIIVLHLGRVGAAFRRAETTPEAVVAAVMGMV